LNAKRIFAVKVHFASVVGVATRAGALHASHRKAVFVKAAAVTGVLAANHGRVELLIHKAVAAAALA
jgi:hypothetical protein